MTTNLFNLLSEFTFMLPDIILNIVLVTHASYCDL